MNKNIMRQAQELQARLARAQQELAEAIVDGTAGGGAVTVTMDGQQRVKAVRISPEVIRTEDVEMLQDLIMAAINEATRKSQEMASARLSAITGGLKIPGLI